MNTVTLIASVVLGAAFVVAGGSKLVAGPTWRDQARGLGAPAWLSPIVPWVELTVGALLIAQVGRPYMAIVAIVLLLVFSVAIIVRLARGEHPPCACFGAWSAKPIGPGHLARNAVLLAIAVLALFQ